MYGQIAGTETVTGNVYRWGLPPGARAAQISDARVGRIGLVVTDVPRSLVGKRKLALVFADVRLAQKVLDNRWSLLRLTIAPGPTEAVTGQYAASPTRETWRVLSAVNAATGAPLNLRPNSLWGALVRTGVTTYEPGKVAPRPAARPTTQTGVSVIALRGVVPRKVGGVWRVTVRRGQAWQLPIGSTDRRGVQSALEGRFILVSSAADKVQLQTLAGQTVNIDVTRNFTGSDGNPDRSPSGEDPALTVRSISFAGIMTDRGSLPVVKPKPPTVAVSPAITPTSVTKVPLPAPVMAQEDAGAPGGFVAEKLTPLLLAAGAVFLLKSRRGR